MTNPKPPALSERGVETFRLVCEAIAQEAAGIIASNLALFHEKVRRGQENPVVMTGETFGDGVEIGAAVADMISDAKVRARTVIEAKLDNDEVTKVFYGFSRELMNCATSLMIRAAAAEGFVLHHLGDTDEQHQEYRDYLAERLEEADEHVKTELARLMP